MQGKNESTVQSESVDWRLSFGAVRFHNHHLQIRRKVSPVCPICQQGLDGAMERVEVVEKPDKKDEVAKSDGADDKPDATSSYSDWAAYYGKKD